MFEVIENVEIECASCSTVTNEDERYTLAPDSIVCSDCMRMCERCEEIGSVDDSYHCVNDEMWCHTCTEYSANWCDTCDNYFSGYSYSVEDNNDTYCESCFSDSTYYCEDCDASYSSECDEHNDDYIDGSRLVHDYSYRPDAIFHTTDKAERLFFGIEIEVEAKASKYNASVRAQQLEPLELAYLKHDGSLQNGFEIVTHPMTHDFYKNEADELWATLEELRTNQEMLVKSWDTRTCGLHIHVSRTGFTNGSHMHRFLNLIYSNQHFYETMAGRSSAQWAKFDDVVFQGANDTTYKSFRHKLNFNRHSDRYSAVNTQNRETLEIRIFRGTVNSETIKAQLDLAHASVEYTRNLSVRDVREGAMSPLRFVSYIMDNHALYSELCARISKYAPQFNVPSPLVAV